MAMTPLVSILIPAYNAQEFISDTIESALRQTWPRKEIIVVDDDSEDRTLVIAQRFASNGVMAVTKTNEGAASARNHAFSLCHGDYIQWLDADDLLAPDKITAQMKVRENATKQTLLSSAWGRFVFRANRTEFKPSLLWNDLSPLDWLLRKLDNNLFMQTGSWLVSRELSEAAGPWDTRLLGDDDGEYFCRVILASNGIRFVPKARMYYRRSGPDSLSYIGRSNKKMEAQVLSMKLHVSYIRSLEDSPRVRQTCVKFLQRWLIHFYPERPDLVAELRLLAEELDGHLENPRLSWKYAWIQHLFGWTTAKRTQVQYNQYKSSALRSWDKALFRLGNRNVLRDERLRALGSANRSPRLQ